LRAWLRIFLKVLVGLDLPEQVENHINIAYHSACSLQHGQQISSYPKDMLKKCGYKISEPKTLTFAVGLQAHIICYSQKSHKN